MNLESVKLNQRSQTEKTTYYRIPFIGNIQNGQIQKDRKQTGGCQALGRKQERLLMAVGSPLQV